MCPDEKRSGCLNPSLLPTRPLRCAVRAHWITKKIKKQRRPWRICATNSNGFSKQKREFYKRKAKTVFFGKLTTASRKLDFCFWSSSPQPSQRSRAVIKGFPCKTVWAHVFLWVSFLRGLRIAMIRWEPPVLSTGGDKRSDGFFWLLFWAVAKE